MAAYKTTVPTKVPTNNLLASEVNQYGTGINAHADDIDTIYAVLPTKSAVGHTHTSAAITDFTEAVQDAVAALLGAGSNITLTYNDAANTFTIAASGGGQFDPEATRDAIGAALIGVGAISVVINDSADTITVSTTATINSTDAQLRDRTTHTGITPRSALPDQGVTATIVQVLNAGTDQETLADNDAGLNTKFAQYLAANGYTPGGSAPTLTAITITGPTNVNEGTTTAYAVTGTYSNSTTAAITTGITWSATGGYSVTGGSLVVPGNATVGDSTSTVITAAVGSISDTHTVGITDVSALSTPTAPTTPVTDDTNNAFGWTDTGGKTYVNAEYSTNGGSTYANCTAKPQPVGNVAIAIGQLLVRYKAVAGVSNASPTLANTAAFTVAAGVSRPTVVSAVMVNATTFDVTFSEKMYGRYISTLAFNSSPNGIGYVTGIPNNSPGQNTATLRFITYHTYVAGETIYLYYQNDNNTHPAPAPDGEQGLYAVATGLEPATFDVQITNIL